MLCSWRPPGGATARWEGPGPLPPRPVTNTSFRSWEKASPQGIINPGSPLGQQRMEGENELVHGYGHWAGPCQGKKLERMLRPPPRGRGQGTFSSSLSGRRGREETLSQELSLFSLWQEQLAWKELRVLILSAFIPRCERIPLLLPAAPLLS